jgi:hypothetical protein
VVEPAIQYDSPADSGADGNPYRVARTSRGSSPPLAQHGAVRIIIERRRELQPVVDDRPQRQVHPAEIRGQQNDAALGIERTRCADTNADDLGIWYLALRLCDSSLG